MKKILIVLGIVILMGISTYFFFNRNLKTNQSEYYYMDTYINVKIYSSDLKKVNVAFKEIDNIYKTYHQLSDRFNSYEGINNVYYINNNTNETSSILLDKKLYDLISYGITWYEKSNGIKNINIGNIVDVWKKYRTLKNGVPTLEELQSAGSIDITDIVLEEDNYILNNHPNIDLGSIAKGYATEEVGTYLRSVGLSKFLINAGGNVLVGDHYNNQEYKIGIQNPNSSSEIYQVVKGNNIAVVTSGGYERYYEYNGKKYNHIIDPNTLFPADLYKSVTVITDNSRLGDSLSLILFVLPLDEGKTFIKQFDNVEAVWYTSSDQIIKSEGFDVFE